MTHVVSVLPFKERYSRSAAAAVALCVDQLAGASRSRTTVLGTACDDPRGNATLVPVGPWWLTFRFAAAFGMGWQALFYFQGVQRRIRRLKPDVIHVHNRPLLAVMLQRAFAPVPVILFLHNDPLSMRELFSPRTMLTRLDEVAGIVAISEWVRRRLYQAVPEQKLDAVRLIPNVVDCPAAHLPADGFDALWAAKEKIILFVGRIGGGKGALPFVEAMAKLLPDLPGWRAAVIGGFQIGSTAVDDPSTYQNKFAAALKLAGDRVAFLGPRPYAETMEWMRRAQILAVPSRVEEAFARVAVEGMFNGMALAVCRQGGALPEVAPEAAGALHFDLCEAAQIAAAVRALARDDADRRARARLGFDYARTHYDPARAAAAVDGFQDELLGVRHAA